MAVWCAEEGNSACIRNHQVTHLLLGKCCPQEYSKTGASLWLDEMPVWLWVYLQHLSIDQSPPSKLKPELRLPLHPPKFLNNQIGKCVSG